MDEAPGAADTAVDDEVFGKLEHAMARWNTDVMDAQAALSTQVARLQEKLSVRAAAPGGVKGGDSQAPTEAKRRIDELTRTLASHDEELAAAKGQAGQLKENLAAVTAKLQTFQAQKDQGSAAEQTLRAELDGLRAELKKSREDLEAAGRETAHLREDAVALSAKAQASQGQKDQEAALGQTARAELEGVRAELGKSRENLEAAQRQTAQLREDMTARLQTAQQDKDQAAAAERSLRGELETLRTDLARAQERLASAGGTSGAVDELKKQLETERTRANGLQEQAAKLGSEREKTQAAAIHERAALAIERDEAQQTAANLRAEIAMLRQANASLGAPVQTEAGSVDIGTVSLVDAEGRKRQLGDVLVALGAMTQDQLNLVNTEHGKTPQRWMGSFLVEKGFATEEVVARLMARLYDLPFLKLTTDVVDPAAPKVINGTLARRRMCIPIKVAPDHVVLAMQNPQDLIVIDDVTLASRRRVEPVIATASDIAAAIVRYYGGP